MAGKKQLEPVDMTSKPKRGSVTWAAEHGSRLESLYAVRAVITRHIDSENTLARDLAALTRQFTAISKEIEELEALERQYAEGMEDAEDGSVQDAPFRAEAI